MKKILLLLFLSMFSMPVIGQNVEQPVPKDSVEWRMFAGDFYNNEYNLNMSINLYDTVIVVRRFEFLGKMNGYMYGNLHEAWFMTSFSISGNTANLHFTNEMGADDQEIKITMKDSTHMTYETVGGNNVRKVENRKWVKLPGKMKFLRRPLSARKPKPIPDLPRTYRKY